MFHVHFGYALGLRLLPWKPYRRGIDGPPPSVSLIIPACNEETVLRAKLKNALALDYPSDSLEILVASDGSADRTVEIARDFTGLGVKVLAFKERRGKAAVLNDAVEASSGELLMLCDANVMFERDALRCLVGRLADSAIGAVSGDVRLASHEATFGRGERLYYRVERAVQLGESRVGALIGVDGGMYLLRRELYQPLRYDTILDDFVTTMRVLRQGRDVVYEPSAVAHENATPNAWTEFRRRVRITAGAVQALKRRELPNLRRPLVIWQFVSHKLLRWLGPLLLIAILAANVALLEQGALYRALLGLQALFYLLAVLSMFSIRIRSTSIGGIPFYFVMSYAAIAVGALKGLLNLQPVTWSQAARPSERAELEATPVH